MPLPSLAQLSLDIDDAISPTGGEPLITAQRLHAILQQMVAVLGAGTDEFLVSAALRTEVVQGTYSASHELTTPLTDASAAESQAGQVFSFANATYAYLPGDAGQLVWVRTFKGGGAALAAPAAVQTVVVAPLPGLEVLAVAPAGGILGANGFNTLPLGQPTVDVRPAGSPGGWDLPNHAYVAPFSGTYELQGRMRINDPDGPVGSSYCLAAGPSNVDGEWVLWNTIFNVNGGYNRKGLQVSRVLHLDAGQAVHLYAYLDGFQASVGGELTVKLLHRDEAPSDVL